MFETGNFIYVTATIKENVIKGTLSFVNLVAQSKITFVDNFVKEDNHNLVVTEVGMGLDQFENFIGIKTTATNTVAEY